MIKANIFIRLLMWLGFYVHVSKSEMCRQAQGVCDHHCEICAWAEEREE